MAWLNGSRFKRTKAVTLAAGEIFPANRQLPSLIPKNTAEALQLVYKGAGCLQKGDDAGAEQAFRRAVRTDKKCFVAWKYLTEFLATHERTSEALTCLKHLIATADLDAANLMSCGEKSGYLKQYAQARELAERALQMDASLRNRAELLLAQMDGIEEQWEAALGRLNFILRTEPDHIEALDLRRKCWNNLCRLEEELADIAKLLKLKPDENMHGAYLFKLNQAAHTTPEKLFAESQLWNSIYAAPLAAKIQPHRNKPDPKRRLKLGYVSPDLSHHAIMKLLPAAFDRYDKDQFEVFAYSVDTKRDQSTEAVEKMVDHFVELPPERETIAARVRADEIDILVDLAGHTTTESLMAFALKPAPVQATWLGLMATTGMTTMDYFIGDQHIPKPGTEQLFSEKIYRLPRAHSCFRPSGDANIMRPPCLANGYITFGCFNNQRKVNRDVVKVWSVIMHLTPGSQMILKCHGLANAMNQQPLKEWFSEGGIALDRIHFEDRSANIDYLEAFNKIDIALDPFPYNGGTTSQDALWMGVPLVSLEGRLAVGCAGKNILSTVGLPVARSPEEYVTLACALAQAMPTSPDIRVRVHMAMKNSALLDEPGLMRALEEAYRNMWVTWCATR